MSRRVHAGPLVKLLESASQPLYVLDDSLTIVYLNGACPRLVGTGRRRASRAYVRLS